MKLRTRLGLCSVSILLASAVYGHNRFESSRYPPTFEVLPGISVYGNATINKAKFSATSSPEHLLNRQVEFSDSSLIFATYVVENPVKIRFASVQGQQSNSEIVQLVASPYGGFLVKEKSTSYDYSDYVPKSYLGIKEIFTESNPLPFDCTPPKTVEPPKICAIQQPPIEPATKLRKKGKSKMISVNPITPLQKTLCDSLARVDSLSEDAGSIRICMLIDMRSRLFSDLDSVNDPSSEESIRQDVKSGGILTFDIMSRTAVRIPIKSDFWKGWDWLFGLGLALSSAVIFAYKSLWKYGERSVMKMVYGKDLLLEELEMIKKLKKVKTMEEFRAASAIGRDFFSERKWETEFNELPGKSQEKARKLRRTWYDLQAKKWKEVSGETFDETKKRYQKILLDIKDRYEKVQTKEEYEKLLDEHSATVQKMRRENSNAFDNLESFYDAARTAQEIAGSKLYGGSIPRR